jgi:hypothetical protein
MVTHPLFNEVYQGFVVMRSLEHNQIDESLPKLEKVECTHYSL